MLTRPCLVSGGGVTRTAVLLDVVFNLCLSPPPFLVVDAFTFASHLVDNVRIFAEEFDGDDESVISRLTPEIRKMKFVYPSLECRVPGLILNGVCSRSGAEAEEKKCHKCAHVYLPRYYCSYKTIP